MADERACRLLSAGEACKRLGFITGAYLTKLVQSGRIKTARVDSHGWKWFEEAEVERFAKVFPRAGLSAKAARAAANRPKNETEKARAGKTAQRVFQMLAAGATLRSIVVELAVDPATARLLKREYDTTFEKHEAELRTERELKEVEKARREDERRASLEERLEIKRRLVAVREAELRRDRLLRAFEQETPAAPPQNDVAAAPDRADSTPSIEPG